MKATMTTGDQIPPAKLAPRKARAERRQGRARPRRALMMCFRVSPRRRTGIADRRSTSHRTTEPIAKLAIARSADARALDSPDDRDAILVDGVVLAPAPSVSVPPLPTEESELDCPASGASGDIAASSFHRRRRRRSFRPRPAMRQSWPQSRRRALSRIPARRSTFRWHRPDARRSPPSLARRPLAPTRVPRPTLLQCLPRVPKELLP